MMLRRLLLVGGWLGVLVGSLKMYRSQTPDFAPRNALAEVRSIEGAVELRHRHLLHWFSARTGDALADGTLVATGPGSKALLRLYDGHEIQLGPRARIAVSQRTSQGENLFVEVQSGTAEFRASKAPSPEGNAKVFLAAGGSSVRIAAEGSAVSARVDASGKAEFLRDGQPIVAAELLAVATPAAVVTPALDKMLTASLTDAHPPLPAVSPLPDSGPTPGPDPRAQGVALLKNVLPASMGFWTAQNPSSLGPLILPYLVPASVAAKLREWHLALVFRVEREDGRTIFQVASSPEAKVRVPPPVLGELFSSRSKREIRVRVGIASEEHGVLWAENASTLSLRLAEHLPEERCRLEVGRTNAAAAWRPHPSSFETVDFPNCRKGAVSLLRSEGLSVGNVLPIGPGAPRLVLVGSQGPVAALEEGSPLAPALSGHFSSKISYVGDEGDLVDLRRELPDGLAALQIPLGGRVHAVPAGALSSAAFSIKDLLAAEGATFALRPGAKFVATAPSSVPSQVAPLPSWKRSIVSLALLDAEDVAHLVSEKKIDRTFIPLVNDDMLQVNLQANALWGAEGIQKPPAHVLSALEAAFGGVVVGYPRPEKRWSWILRDQNQAMVHVVSKAPTLSQSLVEALGHDAVLVHSDGGKAMVRFLVAQSTPATWALVWPQLQYGRHTPFPGLKGAVSAVLCLNRSAWICEGPVLGPRPGASHVGAVARSVR